MRTVIVLLAFAAVLKFGDAAIASWTTPVIGAGDGSGTLSVPESQATGGTITTYVATSTAHTIGAYTLVSAVSPFALSTGGVLTITAALDYETTTSYTLLIQVVDNEPSTGTATIVVTVTDVNEAPSFTKTSYATTIADGSTAGATLMTTAATDQDSGDTITYSIAAGNTGTDFAISNTGGITVATGKTLASGTTPGYALQVEAVDNDGTPLTGTTTVFVYVGSLCSGATTLVAGLAVLLLASFLAVLQ